MADRQPGGAVTRTVSLVFGALCGEVHGMLSVALNGNSGREDAFIHMVAPIRRYTTLAQTDPRNTPRGFL